MLTSASSSADRTVLAISFLPEKRASPRSTQDIGPAGSGCHLAARCASDAVPQRPLPRRLPLLAERRGRYRCYSPASPRRSRSTKYSAATPSNRTPAIAGARQSPAPTRRAEHDDADDGAERGHRDRQFETAVGFVGPQTPASMSVRATLAHIDSRMPR